MRALEVAVPLQNRNTTLPRSSKTFHQRRLFSLPIFHCTFLLCTGPFLVPSFFFYDLARSCTTYLFLSSPLSLLPETPISQLLNKSRSASPSLSLHVAHLRPVSYSLARHFLNLSTSSFLPCQDHISVDEQWTVGE